MAVELNFERSENIPWGFRLTGGADLEFPLTVIKVFEGSIADLAGMRIGDSLLKINDTSIETLTHAEAQEVIINAGDHFIATVMRGELPQIFTETISEEKVDTESTTTNLTQSLQIDIKTSVTDTTEIILQTDKTVEQNIKINGELMRTEPNVDITITTEKKTIEEEFSSDLKVSTTTENVRASVEEFISSNIKAAFKTNEENEKTQEEEIKVEQEKRSSETEHVETEFTTSTDVSKTVMEEEISSERVASEENISAKTTNEVTEKENLTSETTEETIEVNEETVQSELSTETADKHADIEETKGIDFQKFAPDISFIKESEVLKAIQEEKTEIIETKPKPEKRWTTFLQKPNRPIPKMKRKEPEEPKEPPYKVIIKKQKKKSEVEEPPQVPVETAPPPEENTESNVENDQEKEGEISEEDHEGEEKDEDGSEDESDESTTTSEEETEIPEMQLSREEQLAAIRTQLLSLSQLPAAIQQTLNAVTQQLALIVGPVQDQNTSEIQYQEETEAEEVSGELETLNEITEEVEIDKDSLIEEVTETTEVIEEETEQVEEVMQEEQQPQLTPEELEAQKKMEKKQKDIELLAELKKRRFTDRPVSRQGLVFGMHRQQEMTEKIYQETLIAQSEVIRGNTMGDANTHLVPSKAVAQKKINFLKYEPPSVDHLQNSEVYKMIHENE